MLKDQIDLKKKTLIYVASPGLLQVVYQAIRRYPDYMRLFPEDVYKRQGLRDLDALDSAEEAPEFEDGL